ncbi:Regulatory protein VirG [Rhodovastum atsumiense]|uniref:Regulatory protein VirG n=1 Tax=Rhodovastum atsumiense TaxID=504468 RepID=A0A5M6IZB0_9PROT|nr:response regulator [Rhodovastum atsumiense]KAA5612715.1 response regulator [Rhodovastum atsumiense]CAH2602731.1 Regulatory protein VirG [Rhodovastum atsumiense]
MSSRNVIRVLLVEDDPGMQGMVADYLSQHDIQVGRAGGAQEMQRLLAAGRYNLVILDLRLGQENGLDLLRELRTHSDLPVIITTGHRKDEIDRVVGLELGADDYLTKPFSLRELLARIRVVLRRLEAPRAAPDTATTPQDRRETTLRFGQWTLDRRARRLHGPDGPVTLTKGEYALLCAFVEAPQRPLSREQLLQATRVHEDVFDRSIDVQILRLRRKLESNPSAPSVIRTERGVGYVFTLPVTPA